MKNLTSRLRRYQFHGSCIPEVFKYSSYKDSAFKLINPFFIGIAVVPTSNHKSSTNN